jgi:hypothetical protein
MDSGPPRRLIAVPMQLVVVEAADWNRELVADLSPESARLRKAQMMRIGGRAAA